MSALAAAPPAPAASRRGLILLLGAITMVGPMSIDLYLPSLPFLARDLHASAADAEITVGAFFVGIAVGQLVYGPLSDRIGRRWPLLAGVLLYILASIGCALAPNLSALIGCRVLQALGGCAGMVIARAVVRDSFDHKETAHVYSLLMLVMGLAPILAPLLGGWLMLVGSWRWLFWVLTVFGAAIGLAALVLLPESRSAEARAQSKGEHPFRSYFELLRQPALLGYVGAGAFAGAAMFTYISASPDVVIGAFGFPPQSFGLVFGANAAAYIGTTQANRRLLRDRSADWILRRGNLATFAVSLLLLAGAWSGVGQPWSVLIPLFLVMGSLGFSQPNALAGAMGVDPARAGSTSALVGAAGFGIGAAFAALAAALPFAAPQRMSLVIALSFALSVVCLRTLVRPKTA